MTCDKQRIRGAMEEMLQAKRFSPPPPVGRTSPLDGRLVWTLSLYLRTCSEVLFFED